jgi:hypothetical protein
MGRGALRVLFEYGAELGERFVVALFLHVRLAELHVRSRSAAPEPPSLGFPFSGTCRHVRLQKGMM